MPPTMGIVVGYEFRTHRNCATDHGKNVSADLNERSRAAGAYLYQMSRVARIPRLVSACISIELSNPFKR